MCRLIVLLIAVMTVATAASYADVRTGGVYSVAAEAVDGGGGRATGACYVANGSFPDIGGVSAAESPLLAVKAGYVGRLNEATGLTVTSTPVNVNEGGTSQLGGVALMDDGTRSCLTPGQIIWIAGSPAIAGINGNGLLTAGVVYTATLARVDGAYMGVTGSTYSLVLDNEPDNCGSYSGDGLPDWWQVQHFGTDNPDAAPGAKQPGSKENNLFKYTAGLDPTNPASYFHLDIARISNLADRVNIVFSPRLADRTYILEMRTNMLAGDFDPLSGGLTNDNGSVRVVTDPGASNTSRFYRIRISFP